MFENIMLDWAFYEMTEVILHRNTAVQTQTRSQWRLERLGAEYPP